MKVRFFVLHRYFHTREGTFTRIMYFFILFHCKYHNLFINLITNIKNFQFLIRNKTKLLLSPMQQ